MTGESSERRKSQLGCAKAKRRKRRDSLVCGVSPGEAKLRKKIKWRQTGRVMGELSVGKAATSEKLTRFCKNSRTRETGEEEKKRFFTRKDATKRGAVG